VLSLEEDFRRFVAARSLRVLTESLRCLLVERAPEVKEVLWTRRYKDYGYELRREIWDGSEYGGDDLETTQAYTVCGEWIGNPKTARFLCVKHGILPEKSDPEHCVCSIGFKEASQQWCGWSHRAIACFGIGDKLFQERCPGCTDKTPYVQHGTKTITTLEQAKLAAKNFARSVS